jgi:hypothetical protein
MLRATFNDGQPEVPGNFSDGLPTHSESTGEFFSIIQEETVSPLRVQYV